MAAGASVALGQAGAPPSGIGPAPGNAAAIRTTGVISVDFKDEPIQGVADTISRMVGVNVVVAPGIDKRVTVKLENLPYEEVLREIATRCDLVVTRKGANLLRIENPPRVSITFTNADIKQAIDLLARQADVNIVVAEQVTGSVNLRLKNVPWEQALETLVKTAGFFLVSDETGVTRVITKDMLKEQTTTQVFILRYIQPPSAYTAKITTEFAVGQPKASVGEMEQDFTLFKAIKSVLSETGQVQFDKDKNALVVTDIPTKLKDVENVVKQIDIEPLQVFVDSKFVTTQRNDLLDFGTDWSQGRTIEPGVRVGPGGLGTWGFVFGNPGTGGSGFEIGRLGTQTAKFLPQGFQNPPGQPFNLPRNAAGNSFDPTGFGGNFGILDFARMAPILQTIKQDDKSTITQAPKLLVMDNQQATIFVGQTIRFAETFASSNQQGALEFGIREAANSPVQTGFQLLLIPHVIRELNQVILNVIPQFETLTGPVEGFDVYTSSNGTQIRLPRIASDTVITKLKLDSGQTAVIGGLVNEQDSDQITKVPILGDIPFAGWAFKTKTTIKTKANLYIFLTIHVLDRGQETRAVVAENIETDNETRTGKPLFLKERMVKNAQEQTQREEDSRKAYAPILRGSEFKPYAK
jgi:type IV pilus assembly protein PilQ